LIDIIFKDTGFYKHCQYCGMIYNEPWETKLYQMGNNRSDRYLFNNYQISTGVGPCCMNIYDDVMESLKGDESDE